MTTLQDESLTASRLRLAVTRLHRRLRQQTAEGLTPSQLSALATIGRLGEPTLGELATQESVQPPSMTRIVGALEELGYVVRTSDAGDRRVARVALTPSGGDVLARTRSLKDALLAARLHQLTPEELTILDAALPVLERLALREDG